MSWLSDTLGSVAGSVLGSSVQNHFNSANAAQNRFLRHFYQFEIMQDARHS